MGSIPTGRATSCSLLRRPRISTPPTASISTKPVRGLTSQTLGDRSFRRLWASSWCYYVARMMELAVLLWLVLDLTGSPSRVVLVGVFRSMPMFLLGLVVGGLADRFPRKYLLLAAQTLNACTATTMAILLARGEIEFWYAYVAVFTTGCAWAADFSARRALLSELFSGPGLVNAVSLDSAVLTGSNMLGPLLGGILIYLGGFAGAYMLLAGLYTTGVLFILLVPAPIRVQTPETRVERLSQLQTLRSLRGNRTILAVLLVTITLNLFGFPYQQMLPLIARNVLGTGPVLYGALASAVGVGAIAGSLLIATGRFRRHGTLYSLGGSLMIAALFVFAFSEAYLASVLLLLVAGLGMSAFSILQPVIVLQAAPPHVRGRAMGAIALCIGFNPLGALLVGQLAEAWGPQAALAALTAAGFLVLMALRWRYPSLRDKATATAAPSPMAAS